jgi:2-polyprenyl-6-methoxyphenol hydroxylase-like FAD-dependent oxidoreductase
MGSVSRLRILIAGGGIAGLSLARALDRAGIAAEVVERSSEPRTSGAGLYLPANAVRALRGIGLGDTLAEQAQPVRRQRLLDNRGKVLAQFATSSIWGEVGECFAISRGGLHDILLGEGAPSVRMGVGVDRSGPDGQVTFTDGTEGSYDLVVGADGIGSAVRASAFAGAPAPRFLNQVCWRYLAEDPTGAVPAGDWSVQLGKNGRCFLTLPLGNGQVYCYADVNSAEAVAPEGDWRELFTAFAEPVGTLLDQGKDAYFAPLMEIDDADTVRPHAVLIGDAAHACSPSMAQGGAMALEDAVVLAELLAGVDAREEVPAALRAYQQRRAARVRWVLDQNHRRDKARDISPVVRNLALRLGGEKMYQANHTGLLPQP